MRVRKSDRRQSEGIAKDGRLDEVVQHHIKLKAIVESLQAQIGDFWRRVNDIEAAQ